MDQHYPTGTIEVVSRGTARRHGTRSARVRR
jgi:hypothetical protein